MDVIGSSSGSVTPGCKPARRGPPFAGRWRGYGNGAGTIGGNGRPRAAGRLGKVVVNELGRCVRNCCASAIDISPKVRDMYDDGNCCASAVDVLPRG